MSIQTCENEESLCKVINNMSDHEEFQVIMSMKTENATSTPKKAANLQNDHCKDKNLNSPLNLSFNEKELQELFRSPKFNNQKRFLQSGNITPTSKVGSQNKRKINDDNDILNSELYNSEHFNDFEAIDMLHDLNFVAHFESTKPSDILSTMIDTNTNAEDTDENLTEVNKNPLKDPLSISEEENDTTLAKSKYPVQKRRSIRLYNKQINKQVTTSNTINTNSNDSFKKDKKKLNTKKKYLLEQLENITNQEKLSLTDTKVGCFKYIHSFKYYIHGLFCMLNNLLIL